MLKTVMIFSMLILYIEYKYQTFIAILNVMGYPVLDRY